MGLGLRLTGGLSTLLFSYDQARDAFIAQDILRGDLKILGPASDVAGLFHGPLFYYLIAPFYKLGESNPQYVLVAMILINLLTIIPLAALTQKLFKSKAVTLLAVFLFVISFETVSYARWISNPAVALPTMTIFYLGLWQVINHEKSGWITTTIGLGLSIQFQLFLIHSFLSLIFALLIFKVKPFAAKRVAYAVVILTLLLSTFLFAELKFSLQGTKALFKLTASNITSQTTLIDHTQNYLTKTRDLLTYNLIPQSPSVSVIVGLALIGYAAIRGRIKALQRPRRFLLLLLISNIPLFAISTFNSPYINVGITIPFLITIAYAIVLLYDNYKILGASLVSLIFIANVATIWQKNGQGSMLFQIQRNFKFSDQLELVQKTYEIAGGQMFSINAATNPLFYPTTWAYVYNLYAGQNNLKLPHFHGHTESIFQGDHVFPRSGEITANEFTIVEPDLPKFWEEKIIESDNLRKPIKEKLQFGSFTLLVRQ